MAAEVKVRKMTDADLARVNEIDQLLYGEERLPTWPFSFESYWGIHNPKLSFVAVLDGEIVGFIVGNIVQEEHSQSTVRLSHSPGPQPKNQRIAWMDMIGIHPDYQRRGIGQALIEAFFEQCRTSNVPARGLVREGDEQLEKFMKSLGFHQQEYVIYERDC